MNVIEALEREARQLRRQEREAVQNELALGMLVDLYEFPVRGADIGEAIIDMEIVCHA